jgi:hypothetical protein
MNIIFLKQLEHVGIASLGRCGYLPPNFDDRGLQSGMVKEQIGTAALRDNFRSVMNALASEIRVEYTSSTAFICPTIKILSI